MKKMWFFCALLWGKFLTLRMKVGKSGGKDRR